MYKEEDNSTRVCPGGGVGGGGKLLTRGGTVSEIINCISLYCKTRVVAPSNVNIIGLALLACIIYFYFYDRFIQEVNNYWLIVKPLTMAQRTLT